MDSTVFTSPAELLTRVPITTFIKSGDLRLTQDRLMFTTTTSEVELDAALDELHSVSAAATGIHVWLGDRCLRFAFRGERRHFAAKWVSLLTPLVGAPPAGLRVPAPWPKWAWMLAIVGVSVLIVVAIAALTSLNS